MNQDIQLMLGKLNKELKKVYGKRLKSLILFGSYAKGRAKKSSDIDLALILDDFVDEWSEIQRTSSLVSEISLEFDVALSLLPFKESDWRERETPFLNNLRREGIRVA